MPKVHHHVNPETDALQILAKILLREHGPIIVNVQKVDTCAGCKGIHKVLEKTPGILLVGNEEMSDSEEHVEIPIGSPPKTSKMEEVCLLNPQCAY